MIKQTIFFRLTQVIDPNMHLKAIHGLCVRTHHDTGVVDEDVKVVDLWADRKNLFRV